MMYARIILENNDNIESNLQGLNARKKSEFAFYDLVYLNKNGASITEDTLKIRVYQKSEWANKAVLVIRKSAPLINGVKEDKVLCKEEFDTVEEALSFVQKKFSDTYDCKFKLSKEGIEYETDSLRIWVENIDGIGYSIEFGSNDEKTIEKAISLFDVKERLNVSVPEYLYNKLLQEEEKKMKIVINPDNSTPDDKWQYFNKVRAIVENGNGELLITSEAGKHIFPGGTREDGESSIDTIIRELEEETGIKFNPLTLEKVLELDTLYKDYYDYRTTRITPRYTKTIYYYVKSNSDINVGKMSLTEGEIKEKFKIAFVDIDTLFELLSRNHSEARNGQFFDNENKVVMEKVLKPKYFK